MDKSLSILKKLIVILIAVILVMACFVAAAEPEAEVEVYTAKLSKELEELKTVLFDANDDSEDSLDADLLQSLYQNIESVAKVIRIDYVDADGTLTFAWNLHYATIVKYYDTNEHCIQAMYFDENGAPAKMSSGYYGVAYVNDADGHPIQFTYLDAAGEPTKLTSGYTILCRTYNEDGRAVTDTYFDAELKPVKVNGYYGFTREYNENGKNSRINYQDADGQLMMNSSGYAYLERAFDEEGHIILEKYFDVEGNPVCAVSKYASVERSYSSDGRNVTEWYYDVDGNPVLNSTAYACVEKKLNEDGRTVYAKYYDTTGEPTACTSDNYAVRYEYNELGQNVYIEHLDANDNPMLVDKGYAGIARTYARDGSVQDEYFFDENGEPTKIANSYYGIRHIGQRTVYLNADGKPIFMLNNFLYQNPWVVFALMIALCLICFILPKGVRIALCIIYYLFILYMTLLTREAVSGGWNFDLAGSYGRFLTSTYTQKEMLENVALFLPFGLLLRSVYKSNWTILIGVALSTVIELLQGITGLGGFELNDIINNSLGMAIGVLIVVAVEAIQKLAARK